MKRLIFGLELAYELEMEFFECWDFSWENNYCNFILIFLINTKQIVGFWVMVFPGYLLCYVPLILFLYWLLFARCLWASVVKSRSRLLSLVLVDYMSLWIYRIVYIISEQDYFLGREFVETFWEFMCKIFKNKF